MILNKPFFLLKRIVTGINVPKSINITEELVKELNEKNSKEGPSGIDIEEAKTRLKNEDQFDKQLYRERIKKMHRVNRNLNFLIY